MFKLLNRISRGLERLALLSDISSFEARLIDDCSKYKYCEECPKYIKVATINGHHCKHQEQIDRFRTKLIKMRGELDEK